MRLFVSLIFCAAICCSHSSLSNSSPLSNPPPSSIPTHWQQVWNDEFNYTGLPDSTKWNYDVGGNGWGNKELEFYTEKGMENERVENGNLVIEARKEPWKGKNCYYISAWLFRPISFV